MPAGRMAADDQPLAELGEFAHRASHLSNDLIDRDIGAEIVSRNGDAHAMGVEAACQMAEGRSIQRLPISAMNKDDDLPPRLGAGEEMDDMTRERTIADHAGGIFFTIAGCVPRPGCHDGRIFRDPRPVVVFDLVIDLAQTQALRCADFCVEALVLANNRINSRTSFSERSENMSAIQSSCSAAILRNSARPAFVSRMTWTRRSFADVRRSRWPDSTSRSTRPVTLPLETIIRFETSDSVIPSGTLSSCAMRSKRGSVTPNRSRSRLLTSPS